jgi:hypothetical protein
MRLTRTLFVAGLAALAAGCGSTTRIEAKCMSPDGTLIAVGWYEHGGGAAGWSVVGVNILPAATANVEQAIRDRPSDLFMGSGNMHLGISWMDAHNLRVRYSDAGTIAHGGPSTEIEGNLVKVTYVGASDFETTGGTVIRCDK